MSTKLTLRISPLLIKRAKIYAKKHGKSVSQIVGDYFVLLNHVTHSEETASTLPITKSLRGVLKETKLTEKEYKNYLEKKYL